MKTKIKLALTDTFFKAYGPYLIRKEKLAATRMWHDGVKQCVEMYKKIGSPRVYLFFDTKHCMWSPMTYEPNKKLKPSLRVLRSMGKLRGKNLPRTVEDMKRQSFYYTPSKWGALGCNEDNRIRIEKLKMWVDYYLFNLSSAMKKYLEYRQGYDSRRHR